MSREGRRRRAAARNEKSAFKDMLACILALLLTLFLTSAELCYRPPEIEQLERFQGAYADLQYESGGRYRAGSYRLRLEDGSVFFVHRDLDAEYFEAQVHTGDEIIVLADTSRGLWHFRHIVSGEPLAYEIVTIKGEKLRDYAHAAAYLRRASRINALFYGGFALLSVVFIPAAIRSNRKIKQRIARIEKNRIEKNRIEKG